MALIINITDLCVFNILAKLTLVMLAINKLLYS